MKQLQAFCEAEREWLRSTLTRLVALESPSTDAGALERCAAETARLLSGIGGAVELLPAGSQGPHVTATFGSGTPTLLVLGHYDTVWPVGHLAEMPIVEREGRLHGPGVFDMKGGIVVGMLALRALAAAPSTSGTPSPRVVVLLTSDEETGSASSRALIERMAQASEAVLVLEPSLPDGALKTSRKGCGEFRVQVRGRAAHAGVEPEKGASAVLELCEHLLAIDRLQDASKGTTLTTGLVTGGTRPNVVPATAEAVVDARAWCAAEADRVTRAMRALSPRRPGTTVGVTGGFDRPAFERTSAVGRLFELAREVGVELGLPVQEGATGGASDGNFTAALGVPTLDGLGAIGDGAHAAGEHVVLDALPSRAALLAGLIRAIGEGRLGR